jgi:hypothetical protein
MAILDFGLAFLDWRDGDRRSGHTVVTDCVR